MKLFVGLGNPGAKYAKNRHNIGFMAIDQIARDGKFGPWQNKFQALFCQHVIDNEKVFLIKPQTFMNKSGQSVGEIARFYKIDPSDIWVFHDEIDLPAGKLKTKQGGGHAGHNGLRSIHAAIGAAYGRVRMGVGHPGDKGAVPSYVLNDFPKADHVWLDTMITGCGAGAHWLMNNKPDRFMNTLSLYLSPPRSGPRSGPQSDTGKSNLNNNPGKQSDDTRAPRKYPPNTPRSSDKTPAGTANPPHNPPTDVAANTAAIKGKQAQGNVPHFDTPSDDGPRSPLQKLIDKFR